MMTIPVNIITGVLGVGKTTAIRHLISQRPANERWAIVVNEFGALGIDGAILDTAGGLSKVDGGGSSKGDDGGVIVREVAGGCLCCAVAAPFTVAVTQLLRRAKPDRLIIEPSGMGHPGGLHDALQDEHLGKVLRIAATIALVDMTQVARGGALVESEAFRDQVQCADVVVGAKGDVATVADQCRFTDWAQALYPPKLAVHVIARGELRLDVLNTPLDTVGGEGLVVCKPTPAVSSHGRLAKKLAATQLAADESNGADASPGYRGGEPAARGAPVRVVGGTDAFATFGLLFHRDDVFLRSSLVTAFGSLATEAPAVVRFKGVVRVGAKEWVAPTVDPSSGTVRLDPVAWRRDSRVEVIVDVGGRRVGFVDGEGTDGKEESGKDRGVGGEEATAEAGEDGQGEEDGSGGREGREGGDRGGGGGGSGRTPGGDRGGGRGGIRKRRSGRFGRRGSLRGRRGARRGATRLGRVHGGDRRRDQTRRPVAEEIPEREENPGPGGRVNGLRRR